MDKIKLLASRADKVAQMENLAETRGENMDEATLNTIKTLKGEITLIDGQLSAIEEIRSVAMKQTKTVDKKDSQMELRSNFDAFLRGNISEKEMEKRAMSVGGVAKGAELVPDEFYRVLDETILEFSNFKADAFNFTTGNNGALTMPSLDDTANTGAWVDEGGTIPLADAATSDRTMSVHKVGSGVKVSTELIEDDAFDLTSWVARAIATRLARTYEAAFMNGDGLSKPTGILTDFLVTEITSAASGVVDHKDAAALKHAIQSSSRIGANFYASDDMLKTMELWEDNNGRPLLQAADAATQAKGILFTLFGYPVKLNTELGDVTAGDHPLIFGNPSKYFIRNVRGITIKRNDFEFMSTDEVSFYGTARLDGMLSDANDTFAKLKVKA